MGELNQNIDVAILPKVVAKYGTEKGKLLDLPFACERGEGIAVDMKTHFIHPWILSLGARPVNPFGTKQRKRHISVLSVETKRSNIYSFEVLDSKAHGSYMKPALLVIDLQKAFYNDPVVKGSMDNAAESINEAVRWFRDKKLPVIWIQHENVGEGPTQGQEDFEFIDKLSPDRGETRIVKRYGNSFNKTGLAGVLAGRSVDTVFVTGFCAEYCVLATDRGARDLDLSPILVRGCLASGKPENIAFVESICDVATMGVVKKMIEGC